MSKQLGMSTMGVLGVAVVFLLVVGLGYWYYAATAQPVATPSLSSESLPAAPAVSSVSDLDAASAALNAVDVDAGAASDSGQLDGQLSHF